MKRWLLSIFLALPLAVFGAAGDIKSAVIESSGWVAAITVDTIATNGAFNFGFLTNDSGPSKVVFTLTSLGFDDSGNQTTIQRTIYGTKQLRFPYPNHTNNDVVASGADAVIRLALSDYVFQNDSNITVSVAASWYSNNAAVSGLSVVNNSGATHPKAIANWSWPGFQRVTGNAMTLRAVGFHRSGQQGRPLRVMRFVARGATSGVSVTNWVAGMTIDRSMNDAVPVPEYIASVNVSGMTQGELMRCDFTAYPWMGDSGAVLDTMDGVNATPPLYSSQTNWIDRNPTTVAVVSYTNNGTGQVVTNFDQSAPPVAFATIAAAVNAIVKSNFLFFNRSNAAGAVIYVRSGEYQFAGATVSAAAETNYAWLHITPFAGDNTVIITNQSGTSGATSRYWLDGLNIVWGAGGTKIFFDIGSVWTDRCTISHNGAASYYQCTSKYFTRNIISNWTSGITRPFSTATSPTVLFRGNQIGTSAEIGIAYTMLGNQSAVSNSACAWTDFFSGMTIPRPKGQIVAFNWLTKGGVISQCWQADPENTSGAAFVQNVFEKTAATEPALQIAADSTTASNIQNFLFINNTVLGERVNWMYNDQSATNQPNVRKFCLLLNNAFDRMSIVSDKDLHGGGVDARRTNNWSEYYGVGYSGNVIASYPFKGDFSGLNTTILGSALGEADVGYTLNASRTGTTNGFGNYRVLSSSVVQTVPTVWYLPFDLEGNARGAFDPPGAYSSASPRKGAAFLGF